VDTGGWVAYFDQSDRFHPLVTSYVQVTLLQAVDRLVTSDYHSAPDFPHFQRFNSVVTYCWH